MQPKEKIEVLKIFIAIHYVKDIGKSILNIQKWIKSL